LSKAVELKKKHPVLQNSLNTDTFESVIPLEPGDYTCRLVIRDLATGLSAVSWLRPWCQRQQNPA